MSDLAGPEPVRAEKIEAAGCSLSWIGWGSSALPALVLVHGARAHSGWWRGVAAAGRLHDRAVVALDLSGHGDSDHRDAYSAHLWAEEVATVVAELAGGRAALAGHSMGGWVTLACAARWPELVEGVVLVDSSVRRPRPGQERAPRGMAERPLRRYRTRAEAVAAFRLLPEQPSADPELLRAVAESSVALDAGGWRWKFDPAMAQRFSDGLIRDHLKRVRCPLHLVYGTEDPLVSAETAAEIAAMNGSPVATTRIPGAHHHAILDHPEEVASGIASALGEMRSVESEPRRRASKPNAWY